MVTPVNFIVLEQITSHSIYPLIEEHLSFYNTGFLNVVGVSRKESHFDVLMFSHWFTLRPREKQRMWKERSHLFVVDMICVKVLMENHKRKRWKLFLGGLYNKQLIMVTVLIWLFVDHSQRYSWLIGIIESNVRLYAVIFTLGALLWARF